jgi:hypothetical protein
MKFVCSCWKAEWSTLRSVVSAVVQAPVPRPCAEVRQPPLAPLVQEGVDEGPVGIGQTRNALRRGVVWKQVLALQTLHRYKEGGSGRREKAGWRGGFEGSLRSVFQSSDKGGLSMCEEYCIIVF